MSAESTDLPHFPLGSSLVPSGPDSSTPSSATTLQPITLDSRILNPGQSSDGITYAGASDTAVLFQALFPAGDETRHGLHLFLDSQFVGYIGYPVRATGHQFSLMLGDALYLDRLDENGQRVMLTFQHDQRIIALAPGTPSIEHSADFTSTPA